MDICPEETETPEKKWGFTDTDPPAKDCFASPTDVSKLSIEWFMIFPVFLFHINPMGLVCFMDAIFPESKKMSTLF